MKSFVLACGLALFLGMGRFAGAAFAEEAQPARSFSVHGTVKQVLAAEQRVLIAHEAVPGYMEAMTMPFSPRDPKALQGLKAGDEVRFQLFVAGEKSWIDQLEVVRPGPAASSRAAVSRDVGPAPVGRPMHPLLQYPFTNELGQAVCLGQFRGQALAITFFFTRCPVPDFCPRLSKNFEVASEKLRAMADAPTNWHFLSVSFDSEHDTPAVLRAYGEHYRYDPRCWSFLTGPADKIAELAALSDATFEKQGAFFAHNFRTLIIDATGRLQTVFPTGGDLSDAIVGEIIKAARARPAPEAEAASASVDDAGASKGAGGNPASREGS